MPTTEERLAALETAMDVVEAAVLLRATADEVATLEATRDLQKDEQDATNTTVSERLGKIERNLSIFNRLLLKVLKKDDNDELAENAVFALNKGPVLKSPDGTEYRVKVADGGDLSTVAA